MDNLGTILVALLAAALVGYVIYRVASRSGSSGPGYTAPGKPRPPLDTDPR